MRVKDLMKSPVITCHVNDTLNTAAQRMWDHDCGALVVLRSDGKVGGVLTDRDICMAAFTQGGPIESLLVNSAMSKHAHSVRADQPIEDLERLMAEQQIRRIPVVDAEDHPVGIVTLNDLVREAVRPGTKLKNGAARALQTMAAICGPHHGTEHAA